MLNNIATKFKSRTMTSQSPRIYTYKITFEEVSYYYYGVHKEKRFEEYYMGSPVTHKWVWDFYTPKKQILQFFDFSDDGYLEAQEIEKRIIKLFYKTDKWCLNENCGGIMSLDILRNTGRKNGLISGPKTLKLGVGVHSLTVEQRREYGKISGIRNRENKTGFCGRGKEKMREDGKKAGKISGQRHKENKTGVCGRSKEKMSKDGKKGGRISSSQVWECTITGHRSNPGALSRYQKSRNIDTTNRIRIS